MKLSLRFSSLVPLTMLVLLLAGTSPRPAAAPDPSLPLVKAGEAMKKVFTDQPAASSSSSLISRWQPSSSSSSSRNMASQSRAIMGHTTRFFKSLVPSPKDPRIKAFMDLDARGRLQNVYHHDMKITWDTRAELPTDAEEALLLAKLKILVDSDTEKTRRARQTKILSDFKAVLPYLNGIQAGQSASAEQVEKGSQLFKDAWQASLEDLIELDTLRQMIGWLDRNHHRFLDRARLVSRLDKLVKQYNERLGFWLHSGLKDTFHQGWEIALKSGFLVPGSSSPSVKYFGGPGVDGLLRHPLYIDFTKFANRKTNS